MVSAEIPDFDLLKALNNGLLPRHYLASDARRLQASYLELYAHSHYSGLDYSITYWRTASHLEVAFVLGTHQVALEVKGSDNISSRHLRGLKAFQEEYTVEKAIVVCTEPRSRLTNGIHVLPWQPFLEQLWNGEIIF